MFNVCFVLLFAVFCLFCFYCLCCCDYWWLLCEFTAVVCVMSWFIVCCGLSGDVVIRECYCGLWLILVLTLYVGVCCSGIVVVVSILIGLRLL